MGVCCVKQYKEEAGEIAGAEKRSDFITLFKNNQDVIWKVVKIQSVIRRFKAMKEFKEIKESAKARRLCDIPAGAGAGADSNSENSKVQEVEKKMGPFNAGKVPPGLGPKEKRSPVLLDNGVTYTGEWYDSKLNCVRNVDTNHREGHGVQIWIDGSK